MKKQGLMIAIATLWFGSISAQLSNLDFEQWDTNATTLALYPRAWPSLESSYCRQIADAHSGQYALQVSVWYYYTKTKAIQTASITSRPASLSGYYKYTDNVIKRVIDNKIIPDTAWAHVYMTQWNAITQSRDTVGRGDMILDGISSWSHFSCPIIYVSHSQPDSITIILDPSVATGSGGAYDDTTIHGYSSFLTVDDLSLDDATGIESVNLSPLIAIYPNPVSDNLSVITNSNQESIIRITDISGREYLLTTVNDIDHISVSGLPAGMYIVSLFDKDGNKSAVCKVVKE